MDNLKELEPILRDEKNTENYIEVSYPHGTAKEFNMK
jgi:hypothetical protein